MQDKVRKDGLPCDRITTQAIATHMLCEEEVTNAPTSGIYVHGLFLEGASWRSGMPGYPGHLIDQRLGVIYSKCPVFHIHGVSKENKITNDQYTCPVYYTTSRGPLTYKFNLNLNMDPKESVSDKWTLNGTALIMNDDI